KDPMIVFEDADLDLAAAAAVWGAFCNSGQSCSSVERLYAHESIAVELTGKIIEKTRMLKQGDPMLEDVSIGAMSSERQIRIVENHVDYF
ncbi:aldehyde dehydrogenase family protein, partial [Escherichia coli]|nr:aldehyde dehydrogenase family protein [Escherichia coli]